MEDVAPLTLKLVMTSFLSGEDIKKVSVRVTSGQLLPIGRAWSRGE